LVLVEQLLHPKDPVEQVVTPQHLDQKQHQVVVDHTVMMVAVIMQQLLVDLVAVVTLVETRVQ
jgi:hypothetical protein|tara:strand:- start:18 stop:206 length:189 start_codon:yes stop_codon:yes gene_type:complete